MRVSGQRQVRRLHVPRDDGRRTGNAGRRVVYRRHWRHVARYWRRAGCRTVTDVLAHASRAHVAAASAAADVSAGWARLTAGRRTVTCEHTETNVNKTRQSRAVKKHRAGSDLCLEGETEEFKEEVRRLHLKFIKKVFFHKLLTVNSIN